MSNIKLIHIVFVFFCCMATQSSFASDTSIEAKFAKRALPLLAVSGYPWTQESVQNLMSSINEECGRRGMQLFMSSLRHEIGEEEKVNIGFVCPGLSLIDIDQSRVDDPLGIGVSIGFTNQKSAMSVISLGSILKAIEPYFKKLPDIYKKYWPKVKSAITSIFKMLGQAAAQIAAEQLTCKYTGYLCN